MSTVEGLEVNARFVWHLQSSPKPLPLMFNNPVVVRLLEGVVVVLGPSPYLR